ncbi:MAG: hypothetical protein AAGA48_08330 [Myxococcota bacterium]
MNPELLERLRSDLAVFWPDRFRLDRVSHPEDWLVFADALQESGDQRGELIDLERRFAETGNRAFDHQRALLAQALHLQGGAIPEPFIGPGNPLRPHGFISSVRLKPGDLATLAKVVAHPDARLLSVLHLEPDPPRLPELANALAIHPEFAQLRGLAITSTLDAKAMADLLAIPHLGGLTALTLAVDEASLAALVRGPWRPRRAVLSWTPSMDAQVFTEAPAFAQLEELVLRGPLSDKAAEALVPQLGALRRLTLMGHGPQGTGPFATMPGLPNLETVDVLRLATTTRDVAAFVAGAHRPSLERVRIRCSRLGDAKPHVGNLTGPATIEVDLDDERCGQAMATLSPAGVFGRTRAIRLGQAGAMGFRALLQAPDLSGLERLDGRRCDLNSARLRALFNRECPRLTQLWLDDNPLGDRGVGELAAWPGLSSLVDLRLLGTEMTLDGLMTLMNSPHLNDLRVLHLDPELPNGDLSALAAAQALRPQELVFVPQGPQGLPPLARSSVLSQVRRLTLSGPDLQPADLAALLESPHLTQLEVLDLRPRPHLAAQVPEATTRLLREAQHAWPKLKDIRGVSPEAWLG